MDFVVEGNGHSNVPVKKWLKINTSEDTCDLPELPVTLDGTHKA